MSSAVVSVIGASARAAAMSAWRAGWRVRAGDLFGDVDLRRRAAYHRPRGDYPLALADVVRRGPDIPWMYTGGIENHPELVDLIARSRPLWGNTGATLRAARDPFVLGGALRKGGFRFPESLRGPTGPDSRYLVKPLSSAGGHRIRFAPESSSTPAPHGHYYQRFRSGASGSATYVGYDTGARILGVTRQLIGEPWLHASPFAWCGNIGPIDLRDRDANLLERLGLYLVERFGLAGLFGVDFVISDEGLSIVEVNPRYPASLEVLEIALGQAALPLHRAAFEKNEPPPWPGATARDVIGKGVLFAPERLVVGEDFLSCAADAPFDLPIAADLPSSGTEIRPGQPVLTVYARGDTEKECRHELESAAATFKRRLLVHEEESSRTKQG